MSLPLDPGVAGIPEGYRRLLGPRLMGPWTPEVVARLDVPPGGRVLDLACGTGLVAAALPPHARVVGMDAWDEMLPLARETCPGPRFSWLAGDFHRLPFREASFDALACQQALQFADDPVLVLREARRVLRPGCRAVFAVWAGLDASPGFAALAREVGRHWGEDAAPGVAMPFRLDDAGVLRSALEGAGFEDVRVERLRRELSFAGVADFVRAYVAGSYLLDLLPGKDAAARQALLDGMEAALAPWKGPSGLVFPIEAHLAGGRAP